MQWETSKSKRKKFNLASQFSPHYGNVVGIKVWDIVTAGFFFFEGTTSGSCHQTKWINTFNLYVIVLWLFDPWAGWLWCWINPDMVSDSCWAADASHAWRLSMWWRLLDAVVFILITISQTDDYCLWDAVPDPRHTKRKETEGVSSKIQSADVGGQSESISFPFQTLISPAVTQQVKNQTGMMILDEVVTHTGLIVDCDWYCVHVKTTTTLKISWRERHQWVVTNEPREKELKKCDAVLFLNHSNTCIKSTIQQWNMF